MNLVLANVSRWNMPGVELEPYQIGLDWHRCDCCGRNYQYYVTGTEHLKYKYCSDPCYRKGPRKPLTGTAFPCDTTD